MLQVQRVIIIFHNLEAEGMISDSRQPSDIIGVKCYTVGENGASCHIFYSSEYFTIYVVLATKTMKSV